MADERAQKDGPLDTEDPEEIERLFIKIIDGAMAEQRARVFAMLFLEEDRESS